MGLSRRSGIWSALLSSDRLTSRELAIAWLGFALLGLLVYLPNVTNGGFYLDDWSNAAGTFQIEGGTGFGNVVSSFASIGLYRPVLVLYVPITYWVFGTNFEYHLAWVAALAVLTAALFFGVLRTLGVPRIHAWIISGLTLVYPWFDSTRLWATGGQLSLSIVMALAGLWLALVGLSRRSWRWHACAAPLYLLSILTYEITLPLIALAGILYTMRFDWKTARGRWGVDLAIVVAGGLWVGTHTARTKSGLSGSLSHLEEIVTAGGTLLGRSVWPVGAQATTVALSIVFASLATGLVIYALTSTRPASVVMRDGFSTDSGWGLREWLLLTSGGLAVAALGWTMLIPAHPYYTPSVYGVTNRVNALAGLGLVTAAYGTFGLIGEISGLLRRTTNALSIVITLTLAASLGLAYSHVLRRHTEIWNTAYLAEKSGLQRIRARFPDIPHGTTLFVSGYPANQTLGVAIFSASWDLDGMIKTMYDDGTLEAYPVLPESPVGCTSKGIRLEGVGLGEEINGSVPYSRAQLFDIANNLSAKPGNLRECRAIVDDYVAGPLYLSTEY